MWLGDGTMGTLDEWPVGPSRPEWTQGSGMALWGAGLVACGVALGLGACTQKAEVDAAGLRAQEWWMWARGLVREGGRRSTWKGGQCR